eukprot:8360835-Alexandrium_andersonii.AAC.1
MSGPPALLLWLAHALRTSEGSPQAGPPLLGVGEGSRAQEAKPSPLDQSKFAPQEESCGELSDLAQ